MLVTRQLAVWLNFLVMTFFKISSFLFNRRKKLIGLQVWNSMRMSK